MSLLTFATIKKLNAVDNRDLLAQVKDQALTGLAVANPSTKEQIIWLFIRGEIIHGYRENADQLVRASDVDMNMVPAWNIAIYPLPARAIQFCKILIEHKTPPRALNTTSAELSTLIKSFNKEETATLLHIHWKDAEGFVLASGGGINYQQAVFLSPEGHFEGEEALAKISDWQIGWPAADCRASIYRGSIENEAWIEAHLCLLFEWWCSSLLERYGYLTGKMMVGSVTRDLTVQAGRENRDFTTKGANISDRTIFTSPQKMAHAYRTSLQLATRHVQTVVGVGMITIIVRQYTNYLNNLYRTLAQQYNFFE